MDFDKLTKLCQFYSLVNDYVVEMKEAGIKLPDFSSADTIVEVYNNCNVNYKAPKGAPITPSDKTMNATITGIEPIKDLAKNQNKRTNIDTLISIERIPKYQM